MSKITVNPPATWILYFTLFGLLAFSFNTFMDRFNIIAIYDAKRYFVLILIAITSLYLLLSRDLRQCYIEQMSTMTSPVKLILLIWFSFAFIANVQGFDIQRGFLDFLYFIGLWLLVVLFSLYAKKHRARIYQYLIWIGLLLFFSVLAGFWLRVYFHIDTYIHGIFGFANARFLNQMQVWLIIPTVYFAIINQRKKVIYYSLRLALVIQAATLVALDARGTTLALTSAMLIWAYLDRPLRSSLLKMLWQTALAGVAFKLIVLEPLPAYLMYGEFTLSKIRTSSAGRLELWREAIQLSSFWGLGGDGFACHARDYYRPHNSLLLVAVNWGVVSALCYLLLIVMTLREVITTPVRKVRVAGLSLLAGIAYSLVSSVFDTPLSQLLAVLSLSCYWSTKCQRVKLKSVGSVRYSQVGLIVGALLCLSLLSYRSYLRIENYHQYENIDKLSPQFWMGYNCIKIKGRADE